MGFSDKAVRRKREKNRLAYSMMDQASVFVYPPGSKETEKDSLQKRIEKTKKKKDGRAISSGTIRATSNSGAFSIRIKFRNDLRLLPCHLSIFDQELKKRKVWSVVLSSNTMNSELRWTENIRKNNLDIDVYVKKTPRLAPSMMYCSFISCLIQV